MDLKYRRVTAKSLLSSGKVGCAWVCVRGESGLVDFGVGKSGVTAAAFFAPV